MVFRRVNRGSLHILSEKIFDQGVNKETEYEFLKQEEFMKALIIYFSRADENYAVGYIDKGNTEIVAEFVQELTSADMFKVEPAVPYAADYKTCIEEAKQRIGNAPIKEKLADITAYDTIFIMSPIYWGTYAPEVETALTGLDFRGKTVRVISTHEGSGLGSIVDDVKKMCKGANVDGKGLAIVGSKAGSSKNTVAEWL